MTHQEAVELQVRHIVAEEYAWALGLTIRGRRLSWESGITDRIRFRVEKEVSVGINRERWATFDKIDDLLDHVDREIRGQYAAR